MKLFPFSSRVIRKRKVEAVNIYVKALSRFCFCLVKQGDCHDCRSASPLYNEIFSLWVRFEHFRTEEDITKELFDF